MSDWNIIKYKRNAECDHCGEYSLLLWGFGSTPIKWYCEPCERKTQ